MIITQSSNQFPSLTRSPQKQRPEARDPWEGPIESYFPPGKAKEPLPAAPPLPPPSPARLAKQRADRIWGGVYGAALGFTPGMGVAALVSAACCLLPGRQDPNENMLAAAGYTGAFLAQTVTACAAPSIGPCGVLAGLVVASAFGAYGGYHAEKSYQ